MNAEGAVLPGSTLGGASYIELFHEGELGE
jgi:hypothetical protein